jgi:hypothetical protein
MDYQSIGSGYSSITSGGSTRSKKMASVSSLYRKLQRQAIGASQDGHGHRHNSTSLSVSEQALHSSLDTSQSQKMDLLALSPISTAQTVTSMHLADDFHRSRRVDILHPLPSLSSNISLADGSLSYVPGIGKVSCDGKHLIEKRSLYELINKIENNAREHMTSPAYVPTIDQILHSPHALTWREKGLPTIRGRSHQQRKQKTPATRSSTAKLDATDSQQLLPLSVEKTRKVTFDRGDGEEEGSLTAPRTSILIQHKDSFLRNLDRTSSMAATTAKADDEMCMEEDSHQNDESTVTDIDNSTLVSLPVDLIGCHHPVELILFKANQRARRITAVREQQESRDKTYRENLKGVIEERLRKLERRAYHERQVTRARSWLPLIVLLNQMRKVQKNSGKLSCLCLLHHTYRDDGRHDSLLGCGTSWENAPRVFTSCIQDQACDDSMVSSLIHLCHRAL